MNYLPVFLLVCYGFSQVFCAIQINTPDGKQTYINRLDGLCRGNRVPITFSYRGVKIEGNKIIMNSTIVATEDVTDEPSILIRVQRCANKENLDTCEEFYQYNTDKYCKYIVSNADVWSPFFAKFVPQWKCPIRKGKYQAVDNELDLTPFLMFPMANWFWRVNGQLRDKTTEKILMCVVAEAYAKGTHN